MEFDAAWASSSFLEPPVQHNFQCWVHCIIRDFLYQPTCHDTYFTQLVHEVHLRACTSPLDTLYLSMRSFSPQKELQTIPSHPHHSNDGVFTSKTAR
jgi:hypothetical protein